MADDPHSEFSAPEGWAWWSLNLKTRQLTLSPAFDRFVEKGLTLEQVQARIHPDDRERVAREYRNAAATGQPMMLQFRFVGSDGRVRRLANAAGVHRDERGEPVMLTGFMADLEHARADGSRLFRLQRLYNVLLSVNHAMVDVASDEELLTRTAQVMVEFGGYPFASVALVDNGLATRLSYAGTPHDALDLNAIETDTIMVSWLPNTPEVWVCNDLAAETNLGPLGEALVRAGYASVALLPLVQQHRTVAVVTLRSQDRNAFARDDIELLRQLSADLGFAWAKLGQARRFRALFEEASDAMLVVDSAQTVVDANEAAARLLGYTRDELRGLSTLALSSADDPLRLPVGARTQVRQRSLRRKDGQFVPVEASKRLVGDGLMQVIMRDLTERKRLESQLMLADRLVSLGTLASGVAHELNNPLSWIISNLSQAKELLASLPPSQAHAELGELVTESLEGAHRIVSVVSDLKTFSRPESAAARVSLHPVIDRSVQVLGIQARYRSKLIKRLDPVPDVFGTEAQLAQVFINLLLNAVQALPEGRPDANEVSIACFTGAAGEAVVEVRDTGSGIDPATLPRIFDPFFTTKPPGLGTGLGLSVIYNIVSGLGGRVEVKSKVGQGSTFRVVLPAAKANSHTLRLGED